MRSSEWWAWKVISGCELDLHNVDVRVRISGCMSRLFSLDPFFLATGLFVMNFDFFIL